VFNRGFWDGYYQGQHLGEWCDVYGSKATERKVYVGKCMKYFSKLGVTEFLIENVDLHVGDKILVTGETTGALIQTVDEIRYDLKPVDTATRGQRISIKTNEKVRPNDKLYVLEKTIREGLDNKK
jgi:putative protease